MALPITFRSASGDRCIAVLRRVLVDECGAGQTRAHPTHQLLGARSGRGGQGVPGMPKIMEMEALETHSSASPLPCA